VRNRDQIDSTRTFAPLKPAEDAIILDSDKMSIEDVFNFIMSLIHTRRAERPSSGE
jgi:cytidylate kinase